MKNVRKPAVAGQFYPSDPRKLKEELDELFASALPKKYKGVRALISPHAGYVFSGGVAASAFNQTEGIYKRVFLIGSSHRMSFNGASVWSGDDFVMPYGSEKIDSAVGDSLAADFPEVFNKESSPHTFEHSLEVQMPFLNYKLIPGYKVVPIIIGTNRVDVCKEIAAALKSWFTPENLFVISSDFSHYPEYSDALRTDGETKNAIISNNPALLISTLNRLKGERIPRLSTPLCGWTSVLTLMYMTEDDKSLEYNAVEYKNSGDAPYCGDKERVVGYWAIAVSEKVHSKQFPSEQSLSEQSLSEQSTKWAFENHDFILSDSDKSYLLEIARESVLSAAIHKRPGKLPIEQSKLSNNLKINCGAFVTLHKNGKLRGCIGHLTGDIPLWKMVQQMSYSSSVNDYRFSPVSENELAEITIEISVLSPLRKTGSPGEITLGKHGIYIVKGGRSGVFLPQVATETGWSKEEFLGHCSRDKAGLGWEGWKGADIYIFTAEVFS